MRVAHQPDMPGSWMLNQLDCATHALHAKADAARINLLGIAISRDRYAEFLKHVYEFEAPVELRWKQTDGLDQVIDLAPRIRTPYLYSDLKILGVIPQLIPPPTFVGIDQALGWMYVVERGRRMNGMLHRHVVRRLPRESTIAGNYLVASSPCGTRWQQLGAALDKIAHNNHAVADQIVNAARRAFRSLSMTPAFDTAHAA